MHSAFTFAHESLLGRTGLRSADKTLPPGALISFLQKGLQYVGIEETLQQQEESKASGKRSAEHGMIEADFSLLSPAALNSIVRTNPPIQLNVQPAAAAAALKARLEAEAKLQLEQQQAASTAGNHLSIGGTALSGTGPAQPAAVPAPSALGSLSLVDANRTDSNQAAVPGSHAMLAQRALAAQAAAAQAAAAAMSQLQQQMVVGQHFPPPGAPNALLDHPLFQQQQPPFGAATAADLLALQQQQQQQQQQAAFGSVVASLAAAASEQRGGVLPDAEQALAQGGKRGASATKRVPRKQKRSKGETIGNSPSKLASNGPPGLLERDRGSEDEESETTQPMDVSDNDAMRQRILAQPAHAGYDSQHLAGRVNGEYEHISSLGGHSTDKPAHLNQRNGGAQGHVELTADEPRSYDAEMEVDDSATAASPDEVIQLQMHESEVFMCAWNPVFTNLIATGSGDASARIWEMGGGSTREGIRSVKTLPHGTDPRDKKNKDVTTLEWSSDGQFLATGSYDGVARVWARTGALLHTLRKHSGPIFSLKWNKRGNYILSGSYDTTAIVWDVSQPKSDPVVQQFTDHEAPALDVDWRDNESFASCSTDKNVHIYRIGVPTPLKVYKGHTDEVNAVKWDPSGKFLASCSDDCTAKIWEVESERPGPLYDFTSHSQEIYTVKWSPTGLGSSNPSMQSLLATASFDGTVRLWNLRDGSCYRVFNRHRDSVYSVAFSPSGEFLASGSLAGQMYIWNIEQGAPVKSFKGSGDIFEVAWNKEETMVAACFSSNVVTVIDFDRLSIQR